MALSQTEFGPGQGAVASTLDTGNSVVLDAGANAGRLLVPGGDFVLNAYYDRLGPDLLLSGGGQSVFVKGYFSQGKAPDLFSENGEVVVRGSAAEKLAGSISPGQFAQVEGNSSTAVIGVVDTLEGEAFVSRLDGATVQAAPGIPIFLGDVIETESGSSVGITFIDQSTFALGGSGRMVIDELVYQPGEGVGRSSFDVLKGVFSFVSGKIADGGDDAMIVKTPVLSIGIRGTTVAGKAAAEGSENSVTLLPDTGGTVGSIAVSNEAGVQVMSQPFATTIVTSLFEAPPLPTTLAESEIQNLYGDIAQTLPDLPSTDNDADEGSSDQVSEEGEEAPGEGSLEDEPYDETESSEEEALDGELSEEDESLEDDEKTEGDDDLLEEGEEVIEEELVDEVESSGGEERDNRAAAADEGRQNTDRENNGAVRDNGTTRIDKARDEFKKAIEGGATEEEAFRAAAKGFGNNTEEQELASETFEEALRQGLSAEQAALAAEQAVTGASIEGAVEGGASIREAIRSETQGSTIRELNVAAKSSFDAINDAFRGKDTAGFTTLVEATSGDSSQERAFVDALREGGSIGDAYRAAHKAHVEGQGLGKGPTVDSYGRPLIDYIGNNLAVSGFNPTLKLAAQLEDALNEKIIDIIRSGGDRAVKKFRVSIESSTGDDVREAPEGVGTVFENVQGVNLGGSDVFKGSSETDELTFEKLDNILFKFNFAGFSGAYSTKDGGLTGSFTTSTIEQIKLSDGTSSSPIIIPEGVVGTGGNGNVLAGTDSADTLDVTGDGTSAADITYGSGGSAVSVDVDASDHRGFVIFGKGGNDTIIMGPTIGNAGASGGDGDDTIVDGPFREFLEGEAGNDTFIVPDPDGIAFSGSLIAGGTNTTTTGDVLQIGNSSTSTGETFDLDPVTLSGLETLNVFANNTIIEARNTIFLGFDRIGGVDKNSNGIDDDVTGAILRTSDGSLNLSSVTLSSAISELRGPTSGSGFITDADDNVGRIIVGTSNNDTLSGLGGNDEFRPSGGNDVIAGGAGNDTISISSNSDVTSGANYSGGPGTDTLNISSTSVTKLEFPDSGTSLATLEVWNVAGGVSTGVEITTNNSVLFFSGLTTITAGNGTGDNLKIGQLNGDQGFVDLRDKTFTKVDTITLAETSQSQTFLIDSNSTFTGLSAITGTVGSNSKPDERMDLLGSFDFSGVTFTNIQSIVMFDSDYIAVSTDTQETVSFDSSTDFSQGSNGRTGGFIGWATTGRKDADSNYSESDIFDYKSDLRSGDGTTLSSSNNLTINDISAIPSSGKTDYISGDSTGVVEFETTTRTIDLEFGTASASEIESAIESLLEDTNSSTNLTGSSSQVTQGAANTDCLLIFYEEQASFNDAVIVRYQEGGTSEADFSGELDVVAVINQAVNFSDGDII